MKVFMENPGKALSREEILDMVWGRDYFGELKIVDVNIRRLRLKIEDNVQNPDLYHHRVGIRVQVGLLRKPGGRCRGPARGARRQARTSVLRGKIPGARRDSSPPRR